MNQTVEDSALDILFREARTHFKWQARPVAEQTLRELYEILKWAPTSANVAPARSHFFALRKPKSDFVQR
jgi:3-hydroxypropanoate dehydrogenase